MNTTLARNARDTNAFAGGEGLRRNHHAGKRWNGIFVQHDTKDVSSSLNGTEGGGQFGVERKQGELERAMQIHCHLWSDRLAGRPARSASACAICQSALGK